MVFDKNKVGGKVDFKTEKIDLDKIVKKVDEDFKKVIKKGLKDVKVSHFK